MILSRLDRGRPESKEVIPEKKDKYVASWLPKAKTALQNYNDGRVKRSR